MVPQVATLSKEEWSRRLEQEAVARMAEFQRAQDEQLVEEALAETRKDLAGKLCELGLQLEKELVEEYILEDWCDQEADREEAKARAIVPDSAEDVLAEEEKTVVVKTKDGHVVSTSKAIKLKGVSDTPRKTETEILRVQKTLSQYRYDTVARNLFDYSAERYSVRKN